jgi:hypothetical protein
MNRIVFVHKAAASQSWQSAASNSWAFALLPLLCLGPRADPQGVPATRLERPAGSWAADAARNELSLLSYDGVYLRYRTRTNGPKGNELREVIESRDGTVARLLMKDDHPISTEDDLAEHARLQAMLDNPAAFAHHIKSDQTGKKLASDLIQLLPAAMLYEYAPGQPHKTGFSPASNDPAEVVLDFHPNPEWHPPSLASEALTGLKGRVWIDTRTRHVTRLEAELFRGVNVGWGVVAHINPGGSFTLDQVPTVPQRWMVSRFTEKVTLRALMVKNVSENRQIDSSDFQSIPAMSYQEAIKALLSAPLPH